MLTKFSKVSRVVEVIDKMFLTKDTARQRGLPTHVVDTRYVYMCTSVCRGVVLTAVR